MLKILCHRRTGVNLKLFLEGLGYGCFWENYNENFDYLLVNETNEFLEAIKKEVESTGFIPYHYTLSPEKDGVAEYGDKVLFTGITTQINEFRNINGTFKLILFEADNNYVWKSYSDKDIPVSVSGSGKRVANLTGLKGENLVLFNYGKIKAHD